MRKKLLRAAACCLLACCLSACGQKTIKGLAAKPDVSAAETLSVAYQYSIAYAPLIVMKEQNLIEKYYDGDVEVRWSVLNSGSAINEGMIAGEIDLGALGAAPALIGMQAGVPYKICSGISSQPYGLMTNQADIRNLSDLTDEDKIAVVSLNSMPHILLAMAAKESLGDAHALDQNLVSMSNGDGMSALLAGAVNCQMCISPYNLMEEQTDGIHPVDAGESVWPSGDTFIVAVASEELYQQRQELYQAYCKAMGEAMEYIDGHMDEVAKLLAKEYDAPPEQLKTWMEHPDSGYHMQTQGILKLAAFMEEEGFLAQTPGQYTDLVYENVQGD